MDHPHKAASGAITESPLVTLGTVMNLVPNTKASASAPGTWYSGSPDIYQRMPGAIAGLYHRGPKKEKGFMSALISYQLKDSIATITMDDGKVNVMSLAMLSALNGALDRATSDGAVVVLTGRPGVFSAGFDLPVLKAAGENAHKMVRTGFELAQRILSFPAPVVVACTGHAIAMGVFLVLAADYRIGADGPYRIGANEVAIGITMPHFAIEICRQRLTPAHFHRAVTFSEIFTPVDAVTAGFLDRIVPASDLESEARKAASNLSKLDRDVFAASKLRVGEPTLKAIRAAIDTDDAARRARAQKVS